MSSNVVPLGLLAALAVLVAGVIAGAQDGKHAELARRDAVDVFNVVEVRTVVVTALPESTRVEKGDVVCELDQSELRDRLATQEIVVRGAEADADAARIAREVAVMALIEYKEGTFRQELAATESVIKLTEAKLSNAEDQTDWSRRMFAKGYISISEKVTDELALKHARFALEEAQSKRKVLIDYSKARAIKALSGAVESARACELAKQAAVERERSAQKRLSGQIGRCKVTAPATGRVEYVSRFGVGAVVHDGQLLCRVVPEGAATTKAK
jgi:HlyD family secretion protein